MLTVHVLRPETPGWGWLGFEKTFISLMGDKEYSVKAFYEEDFPGKQEMVIDQALFCDCVFRFEHSRSHIKKSIMDLWIIFIIPTLIGLKQAQAKFKFALSSGAPSGQIKLVLIQGIGPAIPNDVVEKMFQWPLDRLFFDAPYFISQENQENGRSGIVKAPADFKIWCRQVWIWVLPYLRDSSVEHSSDKAWDVIEKKVMSHTWKELFNPRPDNAFRQKEKLSTEDVGYALRGVLEKLQVNVDDKRRNSIIDRLGQRLTGWGILNELMMDPKITEILIHGNQWVYVEKEGRLSSHPIKFLDQSEIQSLIDRMAHQAGRHVDPASPMADFRLLNGCRVNVVLPPISVDNAHISIRKFRRDIFTMNDLIKIRTLTETAAAHLMESVQQRQNLIVCGNTGSGKTTLLNVLSSLISEEERIITLEDAAELQLRQKHVVRLETRRANAEGKGEVGMAELVKNALRMRPDRIIVGECRGDEVWPMIQAMNTGHDGSMTTLHANSAYDALQRLESLLLGACPAWPLEAIRRHIASSINIIIYLKRTGDRRILTNISRVTLLEDNLHLSPIWSGHEPS